MRGILILSAIGFIWLGAIVTQWLASVAFLVASAYCIYISIIYKDNS